MTQAAAAKPATGTTSADLQRLKLQFPQYKTNSLLYVLRRHKFDASAAQRTLLTSSNTRFWRDFHSCGQGLVGVGEIRAARRRPRVLPALPTSAPAPAPAPAPEPVETAEQALSGEVIDALLASVLEGASARTPEPEPEPSLDEEDEDLDALATGGQPGVTAGLGEALDTYRCAMKLSTEGRYSECIPLLEQCVEVFETELPAGSAYTVQAMSRLMAAYKADGSRAATAAGS